MSKKSIPLDGSFGPLSPYVDVYLAQIKKQGYAVGSVYEQVHLLELFGGWLEQGGYTVSDLSETVTGEFLRGLKEGYSKKAAPAALRRLLGILRQIGATPAAQPVPLSASEEIISVYGRFLLEERGLA